MIISDEKYRSGFGLITQVIRVEPPAGAKMTLASYNDAISL